MRFENPPALRDTSPFDFTESAMAGNETTDPAELRRAWNLLEQAGTTAGRVVVGDDLVAKDLVWPCGDFVAKQ